MQRIKIFTGIKENIENEINEWLSKTEELPNGKIKYSNIVKLQMTNNGNYYHVFIVYENGIYE